MGLLRLWPKTNSTKEVCTMHVYMYSDGVYKQRGIFEDRWCCSMQEQKISIKIRGGG